MSEGRVPRIDGQWHSSKLHPFSSNEIFCRARSRAFRAIYASLRRYSATATSGSEPITKKVWSPDCQPKDWRSCVRKSSSIAPDKSETEESFLIENKWITSPRLSWKHVSDTRKPRHSISAQPRGFCSNNREGTEARSHWGRSSWDNHFCNSVRLSLLKSRET